MHGTEAACPWARTATGAAPSPPSESITHTSDTIANGAGTMAQGTATVQHDTTIATGRSGTGWWMAEPMHAPVKTIGNICPKHA